MFAVAALHSVSSALERLASDPTLTAVCVHRAGVGHGTLSSLQLQTSLERRSGRLSARYCHRHPHGQFI